MFTSIKSSLSFSLNRAGIVEQVQAALVCEFFRQVVEELLKIKNTHAVSFAKGVLLVKAPSPVYAAELRPRTNVICERINTRFNKELVERINIIIG